MASTAAFTRLVGVDVRVQRRVALQVVEVADDVVPAPLDLGDEGRLALGHPGHLRRRQGQARRQHPA
jgi:hypothetical protein